MRTISHKDLPNADLSTIGIIPLSHLFPIETSYIIKYPAYIHYDGSLIRFFELNSISTPNIASAIKALHPSSAMQIYRYHTPEKDTYYLSIRKTIEYSDLIPTSIFRNFSFNPIKSQIDRMSQLTAEAFVCISDSINHLDCKEIDYLNSPIPHLLYDFELAGNVIKGSQVRTNFSFVKIGDHKFGTIASLNNMANIPRSTGSTKEHTYLQRILLVSPSQTRKQELQYTVLDNARLIEHLSEKKKSDYSVDTLAHGISDILPTGGKILYSDVTFFLFAESMSELTDRFQSFYDTMEDHEIALYSHTNTSRRTYISLFPGNEIYGERYTLMFEYFLNMLISKALEI